MPGLITPEVYESLQTLIDYTYSDEQKHWQESGRPKMHIFREIKNVASWLATVPEPSAGVLATTGDERKRCDACGEPFETGVEPAYEFDSYESDRPLALHPECWDAANGV